MHARKLATLVTLVGAALTPSAFAQSTSAGGVGQTTGTPLRVMPLGDSITYGLPDTGGYRAPLFELIESNLFEVDFVGSAAPFSQPEFIDDWHHEGHSGWTLADLTEFQGGFGAPASKIETWIELFDPSVILLHAGTNDLGIDGLPPFQAGMRLQALLNRIYTAAPSMHVIVARIVPLAPAFYDWEWAKFNQGVDYLAEQFHGNGYSIRVADMFGAFTSHPDWEGLYLDPIHPNQAGYDVMAQVWYESLASLVHGLGGKPSNPPLVPPPILQVVAESPVNGAFEAEPTDLIAAGSPTLLSVTHVGYDGASEFPITALNDGDAGVGAAVAFDPVDEQWASTFHLDPAVAPNGYDVIEIRGLNYAGGTGTNGGFGAQAYSIFIELVNNPGTYIPVGSYRYAYSTGALAPPEGGAGEVRLRTSSGILASGVRSVRIRFTPDPGLNAKTGYTELDIIGTPTAAGH